MSIYNGTKGIKQSFSSATGVMLCGYISNPYTALSLQAIVPDTNPESYIPCTAVVLKNGVDTTVNNVMSGFNTNTIKIDKEPTAADKIDGFILESESMVIEEGKLYPIAGGTVQIGKIGSGVITFLPCNDNLSGIALSTPIYWDITNKELTTTQAGNIALNIQILGSVVKGQKRKNTAGEVVWSDCSCIEVKL